MPTTFSSKPLVAVWCLFALSLACLDQATKYAIETLMPLRASIEVNSFFNLVHVLNPGAAFSFSGPGTVFEGSECPRHAGRAAGRRYSWLGTRDLALAP